MAFSSLAGAASCLPSKFASFKPSPKRPAACPVAALMIGSQDLADLAHNKVLVATSLAGVAGQLCKPLTSVLNPNVSFDLRDALRSGGMPSSHSAGVAAAAAMLGLERGLSDPIFGMSVVIAALVMCDSLGVRREAGYHAEILNRMLLIKERSCPYKEEDNLDDIKIGVSSIISTSKKGFPSSIVDSYSSQGTIVTSTSFDVLPSLRIEGQEPTEKAYARRGPLNESVGHTEIQVIVGALLGFVVSLMVDTIM